MIYLFAGDGVKKKHLAYEDFLKSISKDIEIFKFNRNNFDQAQIASFCSGSGLFSKKSVIIFSNIFANDVSEDIYDFIIEKLPQMLDGANDFIFLESKLNKSIIDAFKKVRAQLNIFELPKEKKERFDNFLLANAFSVKDKLNLWIYFRQAVDRGVVMEELIGVLFWKIKDMLLKKNFNKFSEAELKNYVTKLSCLLPEARNKGLDAEASFEQFLLEAL